MNVSKHKKYINRKISEGICSRCNKPSFPYYDCADCRFKKRLRYNLERAVKEGSILKCPGGKYAHNENFIGPSFVWYKVKPGGRKGSRRNKIESQIAFSNFILKNKEIFTNDSVKYVLDQLKELRDKKNSI